MTALLSVVGHCDVYAQGVSETGEEELDSVRLGDRGATAQQCHEAFGEVVGGDITAEKGELADGAFR
jgi:hypothetical protein